MVGAPSPNEESWEAEDQALAGDPEGLALEASEVHMLAESEAKHRRHPQDDRL